MTVFRAAAAAGLDQSVWQLTHAIWPLLRSSHDYDLWFDSHKLGVESAQRCGDRAAEVEMLGTWGVGLRGAGRFDAATEAFSDVLHLARAARDARAEAQALHELGSVHLAAGRPAEAEPLLLQARELRGALGRASENDQERLTYRRAVAITDVCLGQVLLGLGRPAEANETLTLARTTLIDVHDEFDAARALAWLGRAYAAGDDLAKGEAYGRQAVDECDRASSARWRAHSRELLGQTTQASGLPDVARSLYDEAIRIYSAVSRRDEERVRKRLQELSRPSAGHDGHVPRPASRRRATFAPTGGPGPAHRTQSRRAAGDS